MNQNFNPADDTKRDELLQACAEFETLLTLAAAGDELEPADQSHLNSHLATCTACSEVLKREKEILALLATNHAEPDAALLASCRMDFEDALDREEDRGWLSRVFGTALPSSWLSPRPAWSAAVLLVIGFTVGILAPRLISHQPARAPANTSANNLSTPDTSNVNSPIEPLPTSIDLHTADVAGINVSPSSDEGPAHVEVQLRAQQPVMVQGTVDNDDVKNVLIGILAKGDRICPDIRLDAVECLRSRENDPDVRSALCRAVRTDHNAAVRLKALEALKSAQPEDQVRDTLLDALVDDSNPGVRVEAINALRGMTARGEANSDDDHMVSVLRERMEKDPNTYIRLQSAAALGELGPRAKF
jgi:HEAT repeats